ncbi:MAG TPA: RNA polymerase sigma factor [Nocardioidaceae bacterium]|nr:RNA polymerase sigma factor [Nocardioidaceae bacterium]
MASRQRRQVATGKAPELMSSGEFARVRAALVLGGVPWDEIDDGVQQVSLRLLEKQEESGRSGVTNRRGWLAVVASHVAVDWHRTRRRDVGLRERLEQRWARHEPKSLEQDRVLALVVAAGLERLSATQRQVLVLRYFEDLTISEISRALDLPEGTVKSRLHAATAAMRTRLIEMEAT